jgi:GAF domain-containing protein
MKTPKHSKAARASRAGRKRLAVAWSQPVKFTVPIPRDEPERLADLHDYGVLDTPPEDAIDAITRLAAQICGAPIALVSLVDSDRQWFKSKVGWSQPETPRNIAFCAHAIMGRRLMVVKDATQDVRFAANPLVRHQPRIRFYAGAPLVSARNHALGTLCVMDRVPRTLKPEQAEALRLLSRVVIAYLDLRRELIQSRNGPPARARRTKAAPTSLDAGVRTRQEFLLQVAHELRTTAAAMVQLSILALKQTGAGPARRSVETLLSSAKALGDLGLDVLSFARTTARKPEGEE